MRTNPIHDIPFTDAEQADLQRYHACIHGVQSAIAHEMHQPDHRATEPKHLRVGVDSLFVETSALQSLLIEKGVITRAEWLTALADSAEREVTQREVQATQRIGGQIKISFW